MITVFKFKIIIKKAGKQYRVLMYLSFTIWEAQASMLTMHCEV